jgi:hypothetical protein
MRLAECGDATSKKFSVARFIFVRHWPHVLGTSFALLVYLACSFIAAGAGRLFGRPSEGHRTRHGRRAALARCAPAAFLPSCGRRGRLGRSCRRGGGGGGEWHGSALRCRAGPSRLGRVRAPASRRRCARRVGRPGCTAGCSRGHVLPW